jgi:hypothetical protein
MANTEMILLDPGLENMLRANQDQIYVPEWRASCVIDQNSKVADSILAEMEKVWPNVLYVTKKRASTFHPVGLLPGYESTIGEHFEKARKVLFAIEGVSVDMIKAIKVVAMVVILGVAPAVVRGE